MSYILDALKKSDQERQKTTGPTLQTVQRPSMMGGRKDGTFWLLSLGGVVVGAILIFIVWRSLSFSHTPPLSSLPVGATNTPGPQPIQRTPKAAAVKSTPVNSAVEGDSPVVEFAQLPDPVQREIPALTFSFHVYSENSDRRTIIINKRRVKAGDVVEDGLVLKEITQEGVILRWKRFNFRINVVEQW